MTKRELLKKKLTTEQVVEHLYLSALSRFPTPEETAMLSDLFSAMMDYAAPKDEKEKLKQQRAVIEDLYWATLSSKEFLFVH